LEGGGQVALPSAPFLFFFFPLALLPYLLLPSMRSKNAYLTAAGLAFYALGQWQGLPVLLLTAVLSYAAAFFIPRHPAAKKPLLAAALAVNLGALAAFKYLGALASALGTPIPAPALAAPLGISFFTFKAMAYVIDVYRGDARPGRFADVLLYISFFPQVTAGPIGRYPRFAAQLWERTVSPEKLARGLRRFTVGMAKKLLLAARLAPVADSAFGLGGAVDARMAWLGAAAYALQLYFDFSGYSDMAIGLAALFGFETEENFRYPYAAASITGFWRRWHISLSGWFRDYLYIPLGGNRRGKARQCVNKCVVFLLCGLWHGSAWTFLLWGGWHGLFSALETACGGFFERLRQSAPGRALSRLYTLLVVVMGFVIFRAASLPEAARMLRAMFTASAPTQASAVALARVSPAAWTALLLGIAACLPVKPWLERRFAAAPDRVQGAAAVFSYAGTLALFALCLLAAAGSGYQPFIYAQF